jgi:Tfp pilus assembly protein PilO
VIEQISPLTRKIVAAGLLVLMVLLTIQYVIAPLAGAIAGQRDELAALRTRKARLQATVLRALPKASLVQSGQAVPAPDTLRAMQHLQTLLAGDAAVVGATLQLGPPCAGEAPPAPLCAQIAVSGSEASISHFMSLVEHGAPVIRFRQWQMASGQAGDSQLHLTGQAFAVWRSPS